MNLKWIVLILAVFVIRPVPVWAQDEPSMMPPPNVFDLAREGALADYNKADYPGAILHLNKVIELSPANADAYQMRAGAYLATQAYDLAWADVDILRSLAVNIDPTFLGSLQMIAPRAEETPVYIESVKPKRRTHLKSDECILLMDDEKFWCFTHLAVRKQEVGYCLEIDQPLNCLDQVNLSVVITPDDCAKMREFQQACMVKVQESEEQRP